MREGLVWGQIVRMSAKADDQSEKYDCEQTHTSRPQAPATVCQRGQSLRCTGYIKIADLKTESKRAGDECATEGKQRIRCKTFGVHNEHYCKSNASCENVCHLVCLVQAAL